MVWGNMSWRRFVLVGPSGVLQTSFSCDDLKWRLLEVVALDDNRSQRHRPNVYLKLHCVDVGLNKNSLAFAKKIVHTPVDPWAKVLEFDGVAMDGLMN